MGNCCAKPPPKQAAPSEVSVEIGKEDDKAGLLKSELSQNFGKLTGSS